METEIVTIEEVARYLRVSDRTVYEWAQKGEIPAGKIGTVWRFKKADIEGWVNDRLSSKTKTAAMGAVEIRNILAPERIVFLNRSTRHDALVELAAAAATSPYIKDAAELEAEILRRENLMSTAIGRGIAIPHARLFSVTDLVLTVGISTVDIIDFENIDDVPVRLLFMVAAAYNQHTPYLQALSSLSCKLKNTALREALLNAASPMDVYTRLITA